MNSLPEADLGRAAITQPVLLQLGSWEQLKALAGPIRHRVFCLEQGIDEALEWDEWDAVSRHAVAFDHHGLPCGTGRLLPDGHIGRMAVLPEARHQGIGGLLLNSLIEAARQRGEACVILHAQVSARRFYERHDFIAEGSIFQEVNIDHVVMRLLLNPAA